MSQFEDILSSPEKNSATEPQAQKSPVDAKQINYTTVYEKLKREYDTKLKESEKLHVEYVDLRNTTQSLEYRIGQLLDILGVLSDIFEKDKIKLIDQDSQETKQRLRTLIEDHPDLNESLGALVQGDLGELKTLISKKTPKKDDVLLLEDRESFDDESKATLNQFLEKLSTEIFKKRSIESDENEPSHKKQKVTYD